MRSVGVPGVVAHGEFEDFAGDLVVLDAGGIEADIGEGFVDGAAGGEEGIERGAGVGGLEEWAAAAAHGALEEDIGFGVEPDDDAGFFEGIAVGGIEDGTAAGGENDAREADEVGDDAPLDGAEALLALFREDGGYGFPLVLDDEVVGIHEAMAGGGGESAADCGFAAAHEADEDKIR